MNKLRLVILTFLIILINCSPIQGQTFKKDWQWLKFTEKTPGTASSVYENALLDLVGNNLQDSIIVLYYDSISTRLNAIIPQIERKYGIKSVQYWKLIDASSAVLTESARNLVKIKKRKQLTNFLKSLEKNFCNAGENKYIYTVGLSDVYNYLDKENKAVYWAQKRFEQAKQTKNINEISGAYSVLAELYIKYHKNDEFADFTDLLIRDKEISQKYKRIIIDYFLNFNYEVLSDRNKSDIAKCILDYENLTFVDLQTLCDQVAKHKDYFIFNLIEKSTSFYNLSIEDRFEYYKRNSTWFDIYNNPQKCIDYLLQAIHLAQDNNRDDLNWHYHGSKATEQTHNWVWVAHHYEIGLADKTNALLYLEKNLIATKEHYGENSKDYYKELTILATNYDLWSNDIEKVALYDSIATEVSQNVFGINSVEHVNSLSSYISCLRRQKQYFKALSMCYDFFEHADPTNVYLHNIFNQAALCCDNLEMNDKSLLYYLKAIETTDNPHDKSAYVQNLSSLFVKNNDINAALDMIEKFQPQKDDPIRNYSFFNAKANILANIDISKAYKTFCEAEKYESSKEVQLLVGRIILHYRDKAKVAPDLHLRFSALQQALKVFDNNNTADSLMYAHIIADMAEYYDSVRDIEQAARLYIHASEVYLRNTKEFNTEFLDFGDRILMFGLSHGFNDQLLEGAEINLDLRKQVQGEMNPIYNLRRFQLLDIYSRYGYGVKADSLAKEIRSAQLPQECVHERDYYLGLYEQYYRKDIKTAAAYYEKYLNASEYSIDGFRIYGDLMDIYKSLGQLDKFDIIEDKYISKWYQNVESKWYHMTDEERENFLDLLKGWQISLSEYSCTPKSIENAANASLFCKGRLTQTTKAIKDELFRLGKNEPDSETSQSSDTKANKRNKDNLSVSNHIISHQDSINRSIVYNDLSRRKLERLVNSSVSQVKKSLIKGDIGIDFVNIDSTKIYAFIIKKDNPIELKRLTFNNAPKTLSKESLDEISSYIKDAKRVFFSPSETMSVTPIESFFRRRFPNIEVHRVLNLSSIHRVNDVAIKNVVTIGNPRFNDELVPKNSRNRGTVWQPLPGTKIEIDSISKMLRTNNIRTHVYTENAATENAVKDYSNKNIDLIHIATHGFYNSEKNESGLLFTGANRNLNGDHIDIYDDGILTSKEIENLYFPNLKLVVLSACETGLGRLNIDGVWGLQRAFRIAGAQNMIVSLKTVDDDQTRAFMINFYKNLIIGKSIYNSFCEAMANADEDTRNSFILIE